MLWSESTTYDKRRELAPLELIKRRFFNRCTAFVVPGKSSANYLQSLGIRESIIFTAPNAVDNALFMRCARAAQQQKTQTRLRLNLPVRYLLYVGRLVREKGVYELLDAYAQLPSSVRSETALVLAGSGSERRELAKRASRIERGNIRFLDFVHRDELAEVYALADALVFPTHSDPWGLVVNEAMACGLPVMTTPVAGCAQDLVHQGVNGFLVEPGDVASLSHAMAKLSEDSQLRERMSLASREQIERYSPETWAEGILSAVQSVRLGL
jgi:glycosyltransferase involved in cell wall biosynthesis